MIYDKVILKKNRPAFLGGGTIEVSIMGSTYAVPSLHALRGNNNDNNHHHDRQGNAPVQPCDLVQNAIVVLIDPHGVLVKKIVPTNIFIIELNSITWLYFLINLKLKANYLKYFIKN